MTYNFNLRLSPASFCLITNILVFLVLFAPFMQKRTICLFDGRHGWKNHNQKNCTKIEKEETLAHRKRAINALKTERKLELRQ
jgi:hypothetical protein